MSATQVSLLHFPSHPSSKPSPKLAAISVDVLRRSWAVKLGWVFLLASFFETCWPDVFHLEFQEPGRSFFFWKFKLCVIFSWAPKENRNAFIKGRLFKECYFYTFNSLSRHLKRLFHVNKEAYIIKLLLKIRTLLKIPEKNTPQYFYLGQEMGAEMKYRRKCMGPTSVLSSDWDKSSNFWLQSSTFLTSTIFISISFQKLSFMDLFLDLTTLRKTNSSPGLQPLVFPTASLGRFFFLFIKPVVL